MRSSAILAILCATIAVASPLHNAHKNLHKNLRKKDFAYEIVTDIVYVTVTEGDLPATSSPPDSTIVVQTTIYVNPIQYAAGSSAPVVVAPSASEAPAPVPTTTELPSTAAASTPEVALAAAPVTVAPPPVVVPTPEPAPPAAPSTPVVVAAAASSAAPSPAAEVAAPAGDDLSSAALSGHNTHRSIHSVGNLAWNSTQAAYAQTIANKCVMVHDMSQGGGGYGQNLASWGSSEQNAIDNPTAMSNAVSDWYGEVTLFSGLYGQANPPYPAVGEWLHFTQLVWEGSTSVGCAVAFCGKDQTMLAGVYAWLTVCNYWPAGNYVGEYAENVFPPRS